jgi:hypothetical protein
MSSPAVGIPVIYVRVSRRPDLKDAPRPPLSTPPGAGGAPSLIEGSEGAAIVTELAPHPEDVVVTKHTTRPFHTTDLGVYLRRFGVSRCCSPAPPPPGLSKAPSGTPETRTTIVWWCGTAVPLPPCRSMTPVWTSSFPVWRG